MRCEDILSRAREVAVIFLLIALILLVGVVIDAIGGVKAEAVSAIHEWGTFPARVQAELAETNLTIERANGEWVSLADRVSARTTNQFVSEIRDSRIETLAAVDSRLGQAISSMTTEVRSTREMLDVHLATTTRDLTKTSESIAGFRADLQPVLTNAEWWTRRNTVAPQVLGVLGATKITMGQVAQMSKTINDATPAYVSSTQGIAKSLDQRLKPKWYDRAISAAATGALVWSSVK